MRLFGILGRTPILPFLEEGGTEKSHPLVSEWSGLPLSGEGLRDLWFFPDFEMAGTDEVDSLVGLVLVASRRKRTWRALG